MPTDPKPTRPPGWLAEQLRQARKEFEAMPEWLQEQCRIERAARERRENPDAK